MSLQPLRLPTITDERSFQAIDPLDSRYYDAEIAKYLSEHSRIAYQAYVEAALAYTLAEFGICSQKVAREIDAASRKVTATAVYKAEETTKHDIKAVVNTIKDYLSDEAKPYVHFGATSYDIIATANALQMRDALRNLVIPRLEQLLKVLLDLSEQYADTVQIGRTHGQHAVPITFGYAMAEYVSRLGNNIVALDDLVNMLTGKFSGAVGAYNALSIFVNDPIAFEKSVMAKLQLRPAEYATQIVPPESMVRVLDELVISAGIMANIGHDMRHLQRTEINEIREKFEKGQTGSSTMAHKRNPWNFENVISMSKQVIAQSVNANLNLTSEHQRDLTDSASSRFYVIMPASVASMASRLTRIMQKIEVDTNAMQRNLHMTGGAIAAEPLYLLFEKYGHTAAHEKAKSIAHQGIEQGVSLAEVTQSDKEGAEYWDRFMQNERKIIEQPEQYYTGLASKKTRVIARKWRKHLTKKSK